MFICCLKKASRVRREKRATLELQVLTCLDPKERKDPLVCLDFPVPKDNQDHQVYREEMEGSETQV